MDPLENSSKSTYIEMEPINSNQETSSKPKKRWCYQLLPIAQDFAENTTLNGLKYMAERGASVVQKFFWTAMFILSIVLCSNMVYKAYHKWQNSAVSITLKEQLVSVHEVPFPAVTICPQAKIRQEYFNYTKYAFMEEIDTTSTLYKKINSVKVLCGELYVNNSDFTESVDIKTMYEVATKHEDIFVSCEWRNSYLNCLDAFRPVLTSDGVCFTFNNLAADEIFRENSVKDQRFYLNTSTPRNGWSLYDNYVSTVGKEFPQRGRANGAYEDLYILLKEVEDRDFFCDRNTRSGFKVYLNHPADLPQASLHYYAVHSERITSFALKLNILETSDDIIDYDADVRQCYFPSEHRLQFFRDYTSSNCNLECLTNYTLKACGCVDFYMPRNSSTDICKANQNICVYRALDDYANDEGLTGIIASQCRCLPSCYNINYEAELIATEYDPKEFDRQSSAFDDHMNNAISDNDEYDNSDTDSLDNFKTTTDITISDNTTEINDNTSNEPQTESVETTTKSNTPNNDEEESSSKWSVIRIYYRHPQFVAMERAEMFGLSQFLADCGGTLGLFLGFSFLTLAEIFYFFTLKLCCKSPKLDKEESAQESDSGDEA